MNVVTLEESERIAEGAFEKARKLNIRISVAVFDPNRQLVLLKRQDGGIWGANYGSEAKTVTALENGHFPATVGARPIYRKGVLIGACGVGGGTGAEDGDCAQAGVDSLKL